MSHDLFFRYRKPGTHVSPERFLKYFRSRPTYQVAARRADYLSEATGVRFWFTVGPVHGGALEETLRPAELAPAHFELNYCRPHVYGLEAEPEVAAFVRAFDLLIVDPQSEGMGDGEYSRGGFLRAWNEGNLAGYCVLVHHGDMTGLYSLPSKTIESVWCWNFTRNDRIGEFGVFVPKVFFLFRGALRTVACWTEDTPILLPRVDLVYVLRRPRGGPALPDPANLVRLEWAEIEAAVSMCPRVNGCLPALLVDFSHTPQNLKDLIAGKVPAEREDGEPISLHRVLDEELLEEARRIQVSSESAQQDRLLFK